MTQLACITSGSRAVDADKRSDEYCTGASIETQLHDGPLSSALDEPKPSGGQNSELAMDDLIQACFDLHANAFGKSLSQRPARYVS